MEDFSREFNPASDERAPTPALLELWADALSHASNFIPDREARVSLRIAVGAVFDSASRLQRLRGLQ